MNILLYVCAHYVHVAITLHRNYQRCYLPETTRNKNNTLFVKYELRQMSFTYISLAMLVSLNCSFTMFDLGLTTAKNRINSNKFLFLCLFRLKFETRRLTFEEKFLFHVYANTCLNLRMSLTQFSVFPVMCVHGNRRKIKILTI